MKTSFQVIVTLAAFSFGSSAQAAKVIEADLCIYGGTAAGVIAAVQAKKMGKSAVIVSPDKHLGGLSSGGLGWTDTGNKEVIGGLSREFYHRVWKHYDQTAAWKWQPREAFGNKGQGTVAMDGEQRTMWIFEPHVAENVFEDSIKEYQIPVHRDEWLDRAKGVKKEGARIASITTLGGATYSAKMFIDATYEGDLMAAARVDYHVGREAQSVYGEKWNGVQTGVLHHSHHFGAVKEKLSPYVVPGDPKSGVLPRISTSSAGEYGQGDKRVQAYCFRMCLTDHPDNRLPFPKPDGYDPKQYELLLRVFSAGWRETFRKFDLIPNRKTDVNNHGPFSTDNIGMNYDYPEASYERRREIIREHEAYQQGWLYFIANEPRVPKDVQEEMRRWGLAKDEFRDNSGWPHQIYVREARRMTGLYVMTENELLKRRPTPDSVGMGSYTIDSHNVQRYIMPEGYVQNEGDIGVPTAGPYEIAYGALVPKPGQCDNLLVPVCVSASHIAFGSIRMEPVFMILGQSAATAACLAIDGKIAVQKVDYAKLRARLVADGQVLESAAPPRASRKTAGVAPLKLEGIVLDDAEGVKTGEWLNGSLRASVRVGEGYVHDGNANKGQCSITFTPDIPRAGEYEIFLLFPPNANRASNVPVTVTIQSNSTKTIRVNQKPGNNEGVVSLGKFELPAGKRTSVRLSNQGTDGHVVADGVQFLPKTAADSRGGAPR